MTKTQHECMYCGHKFIIDELPSYMSSTYVYDYDSVPALRDPKCCKCGEEKKIKTKKIESSDIYGYTWKSKSNKINYY